MILATRGSALALAQTEIIKKKLEALGVPVSVLPVTTKGDRNRTAPLTKIGGDGLFIRELEKKLLSKEADAAVHSGKDLPYLLSDGLLIGCVPEAADPRDCLVTLHSDKKDRELPRVIGTGSPRRISEYLALDPEAECRNIRGNIDTRLKKLEEGEYDAILLAAAGLDRLGIGAGRFDRRYFSAEELIPAPCQGLLVVECRADDAGTREILRKISDPAAEKRFAAERTLFRQMKSDCSRPVGVHAVTDGASLTLYAMFEGKKAVRTGRYEQLSEFCSEICGEIYK